MEAVIIVVLVWMGIISAIIADRKGYNPLLWFIAGGSLIAVIVLLIFPSAKKVKESNPAEYKTFRRNANIAGIIFAFISIIALLGYIV
jgi:4-hydroxybenzoate polyprenyltransferase